MKNKELILRNIGILDNIKAKDCLEEYYFANDEEGQEKLTNILKSQKTYLEKYKKDYLAFFKQPLFSNAAAFFRIMLYCIGFIFFFNYLDGCFFSMKTVFSWQEFLEIIGVFGVAPKLILGEIIPRYNAHKIYNDYLENITTKLEIIKNDRIERGLTVTKPSVAKKINDNFVKMVKETIIKIKSLNYPEQEQDLTKIKEISEAYFAILRKEIELDDVVNLTTNEDIINLQKRLIEIENDAIAKAKIESDESALESEFTPLTTLDRSSVELDTHLSEDYGDDPTILKRKLDL